MNLKQENVAEIPYGAIIKTAISIRPVVRNKVNGRHLNIPSTIPATSTKTKLPVRCPFDYVLTSLKCNNKIQDPYSDSMLLPSYY